MHEHMDQFKLINMNGRVYDPVLAQFLSPDPFVANAASTMSYNRYAYCNYNPLKYVDPSGYVATENSMIDEIRRLWNSPYGGHWNASTGTHFYASYDEAAGSVGGGIQVIVHIIMDMVGILQVPLLYIYQEL